MYEDLSVEIDKINRVVVSFIEVWFVVLVVVFVSLSAVVFVSVWLPGTVVLVWFGSVWLSGIVVFSSVVFVSLAAKNTTTWAEPR